MMEVKLKRTALEKRTYPGTGPGRDTGPQKLYPEHQTHFERVSGKSQERI